MKRAKSKNLFICSSPYTVFNSVNYMLNDTNGSYGNSDIIIFHKTDSMKEISKGLKSSKIFNKVYDYKDFQRSKMLPIIALLASIFPRIMFKILNMKDDNGDFDCPDGYETIVSQNYFFSSLIGRLNKNATHYMIEDGLGTYTYRVSVPHKRSFLMSIANKFLFGGNFIVKFDRQYVYRPEIISEDRVKAYKLAKMNPDNLEQYKTIFKFKENNLYINSRTILFGDPKMELYLKTDIINEEKINKYDLYLKYICLNIPKEKVIYRPHPTEKKVKHKIGEIKIDEISNFWEIECMNHIEDNNVLINYFSTAVFSPKILYNKEPYLLFLYKLTEFDEDRIESFTNHIEFLKKLYSDPTKITIINDITDLKNKLKELYK